jgi:hypothetical protein
MQDRIEKSIELKAPVSARFRTMSAASALSSGTRRDGKRKPRTSQIMSSPREDHGLTETAPSERTEFNPWVE